MELKWCNPEYQEFLIPRLGGLHTAMNFLKAIGQHMQSTGLDQVWVESDLLGAKTALNALYGKGYEKSVRAHKITYQAIWGILLPKIIHFISDQDCDLIELINSALAQNDETALQNIFSSHRFIKAFQGYSDLQNDVNYTFWSQYLDMVKILLKFIRAQREANWDLHLESLKLRLPYFHRYDNTNYAKLST